MASLVVLLGDQLSDRLPAFDDFEPDTDRVLMAEVEQEARYVPHHPQKILLIFAAMRAFAARLEKQGKQVIYRKIDSAVEADSLEDVVRHELARKHYDRVILTHCGEHRLHRAMRRWQSELPVENVEIRADTRFIAPLSFFKTWSEGRKAWRMEYFYREMRKRTGLLMNSDGSPTGGQWNFDAENRRAYDGKTPLPEHPRFEMSEATRTLARQIDARFGDHFGSLDDFNWPTTHDEAERLLETFIDDALPGFGDFQDALTDGQPFLFHALISSSLNLGLLDPLDVCQRAEQAYKEGAAPLNAVEGFIRQILGWREYVRGLYWQLMPDYAERNHLNARKALPWSYWGGHTDMHCIREVVRGIERYGYAHHIQRLMVTGNFALLLGVNPREVCEWYLAVFVDAFEWVELPNTLGMALHADGGVMGSKPYAASGRYIDRQGDYCAHCTYNVKTTSEDDSCPFNSLYWAFLDRNRDRFEGNHRMKMMYRNWDRQNEGKRKATLARARWVRDNVDTL
ncbi:cryptochrome/photolyase family protein [Larsenimonas salina]|uniref:cryptochrome/photolyase family protein n=1 Tax=Larsenimonas salina TaxID=1295565 RepID=UPI0020733609|nr:cryptochrome/photolyase family protein [Larsenimonas salina]MCM5705706.1 cryptochrome/photolyase family protein [Larsenimonas salina]